MGITPKDVHYAAYSHLHFDHAGAANAFLDGYAHHLRQRGQHALAVHWGAWAGGGMAQFSDAVAAREGFSSGG